MRLSLVNERPLRRAWLPMAAVAARNSAAASARDLFWNLGSDHAMSLHTQHYLPELRCYPALERHFRRRNHASKWRVQNSRVIPRS